MNSAGNSVVRQKGTTNQSGIQEKMYHKEQESLILSRKIVKALLKHAESMGDWVKPVQNQRRFTLQKANSFFVGVFFDQGMDTTQAWAAANWVVESIGDENSGFWKSLVRIEKERLEGFMRYGRGGKALHRYRGKMTRYLKDRAIRMEENHEGDPRRIWNGERCVLKARERFEEFPGIRQNLSRMAVLLLVRNYGLQCPLAKHCPKLV